MFGIGKRIEKLGNALADAFNERARAYLKQAGDEKESPAIRKHAGTVAAIMSEIGHVIRNVTKTESAEET